MRECSSSPRMCRSDARRSPRALKGAVTPRLPASFLQEVPNAELYLDADGASLLTTAAE